jgi:nitrous oxide reductase accessory protein NosL
VISVVAGPLATTSRLVLVIAVLLALVGCTSDAEPALPSSTDTAAIAEHVTGPDGQAFLQEITTASWNDDGRRAADLFAWIPRDAQSASVSE